MISPYFMWLYVGGELTVDMKSREDVRYYGLRNYVKDLPIDYFDISSEKKIGFVATHIVVVESRGRSEYTEPDYQVIAQNRWQSCFGSAVYLVLENKLKMKISGVISKPCGWGVLTKYSVFEFTESKLQAGDFKAYVL